MNEHAQKIAEALAEVEQTLRAHHRAVVKLHKALADGASAHSDPDVVALAAAPKDPPPNEGGD